MPIQRQHTNERMSQIVVHNGTVYLAGQVGEDMSAGVEQQTRETLAAIERLLEEAGTDKTRILSVTIYLKDIDADFEGMNRVWDQWLPRARRRAPPSKPLCEPEILVEMSVVARCPEFVWPGRRAGLFRLMKGARCRTSLKRDPSPCAPPVPLIDLQALRHNYRLAREATGARALAVIRRTHTATAQCAVPKRWRPRPMARRGLHREGLELREAGIRQPILLLEGFFEASELEPIVAHDFWCVVHCAWQLEAIERASLARPLNVWLKMDSGMHRVGFFPEDFRAAHERLRASGKVAKIVMMSHFSRADELDCPRTEEQLAASRPPARAWKARSACAIRQPCSLAEGAQRLGTSGHPALRSHAVRARTSAGRPLAPGDDPGIEGDQRPRPAGRRTGRLRRALQHRA